MSATPFSAAQSNLARGAGGGRPGGGQARRGARDVAANQALIAGSSVDNNPEVAAAKAALDQARLDLERTVIRAPIDGVVTNRQVQVGQRVAAGTPLMTIVPVGSVYVDANFKEGQLDAVRPGQPVSSCRDLYGERRGVPRPGRRLRRRHRLGLRPDPGAERDRQLDQGRPAPAGAHRARSRRNSPRIRCGSAFRWTPKIDVSGKARADGRAPLPAAPRSRCRAGTVLLAGLVLALSNFMVVLDTTIANVSVPHIAGGLGVSSTEGTWVITSYAVAEAISVPLTGWLARRFGEVQRVRRRDDRLRRLLVPLRARAEPRRAGRLPHRQGLAGGPLMPLSQTLLLRIFPKDKHAMAMGIWAMTTLVAPIFGPILGGMISDNWGWNWIFFINVPIAIACSLAAVALLRKAESKTEKVPIDFVGLGLLRRLRSARCRSCSISGVSATGSAARSSSTLAVIAGGRLRLPASPGSCSSASRSST